MVEAASAAPTCGDVASGSALHHQPAVTGGTALCLGRRAS
jgi:hypothetical protein